jgi:hypothetical protein
LVEESVISPCHIGRFIGLFTWEAGDNLTELTDKDPEVIVAVFVKRYIFSVNKDIVPNSVWDKELVEDVTTGLTVKAPLCDD